MTWCYATAQDVRDMFPRESAAFTDDYLLGKLESASESVDARTGRTFRTYAGAKDLMTVKSQILQLPSDLIAVTSLAQDLSNNGSYGVTWEPDEFMLWPTDAPLMHRPFTSVRASQWGRRSFRPGILSDIRITGTWGFWEELSGTGAVLSSSGVDGSATTVTLASGDGAKVRAGWTVQVGLEWMFVSAVSGDTLTVERGVNGSTATTHAAASPLSRFMYPHRVRDAVTRLAALSVGAPPGNVVEATFGDIRVKFMKPDEARESVLCGVDALARRVPAGAWR